MERLEELAGFLPEDELRQDRAAIALQYARIVAGMIHAFLKSYPTFKYNK
jgi:hypothetical protein